MNRRDDDYELMLAHALLIGSAFAAALVAGIAVFIYG